MVGGHRVSMEVAKTVLEVADVAWTAVERRHHHHHGGDTETKPSHQQDTAAQTLTKENQRLRSLLQKNLHLLREISNSSALPDNCPSDLHDRLTKAVASQSFLNKLESIHQNPTCNFPFNEPSGDDLKKAEILINVDHENPSWWVWVSEDMVPSDTQEKSEIDNESYVIVSEEHVVDGVATFMAQCILTNPKALNLSPPEIQKALSKAVEGMNKIDKMLNVWHAGKLMYTLATWGLALASLYQGRKLVKLAALGVHHTSKAAMKIL